MKKIILIILVLIIISGCTQKTNNGSSEFKSTASDTIFVSRVIDGDTVALEDNKKVRLLGMDTPEKGQFFSEEAKKSLENMVLKKNVSLEADKEDVDKYDRLLRYVRIGSVFVNLELVKQGYAKTFMLEPGDKYFDELKNAEKEAREAGLGVWKYDDDVFCIGIHYFQYDAWGNDNEKLNGEYVTFRNKCFEPVDLTGWILKDSANNTFIFPNFVLANKTKVTVHTGSGVNNEKDLYWKNDWPIWNNNGDVLKMWDSKGNLILHYEY